MTINAFIQELEKWAPPFYQESYDNVGLITGNKNWNCTGILCSIDITEHIIKEALEKGCNMIVAHHPIIFRGIKKLSEDEYIQRAIVIAIKNDIAIYAIHTNLDNIQSGVNKIIADKLSLFNTKVLLPKQETLCKLYTYVPFSALEKVQNGLFAAGAGKIGLYEECSFTTKGLGSFKPLAGATPFIGKIGNRENVDEVKLEVILPIHLQANVVNALIKAHPYETVAYEIIKLENNHPEIGSGMVGLLQNPMTEIDFLLEVKKIFNLKIIRHSAFLNRPIEKIALCGGAGSFLTGKAISSKADVFITSDIKYHEFFDANDRILLVDIGHWESEQYTAELLVAFLKSKFPTFAILKTELITNPVNYF